MDVQTQLCGIPVSGNMFIVMIISLLLLLALIVMGVLYLSAVKEIRNLKSLIDDKVYFINRRGMHYQDPLLIFIRNHVGNNIQEKIRKKVLALVAITNIETSTTTIFTSKESLISTMLYCTQIVNLVMDNYKTINSLNSAEKEMMAEFGSLTEVFQKIIDIDYGRINDLKLSTYIEELITQFIKSMWRIS